MFALGMNFFCRNFKEMEKAREETEPTRENTITSEVSGGSPKLMVKCNTQGKVSKCVKQVFIVVSFGLICLGSVLSCSRGIVC